MKFILSVAVDPPWWFLMSNTCNYSRLINSITPTWLVRGAAKKDLGTRGRI